MKKIILFLIYILGILPNISSQNSQEPGKKIEICLNFMKFNKDWFYHNGLYFPMDSKKYIFDFIPSIYIRFIRGNNAFRMKFEYFQKYYSYESDTYDLTFGEDGNFKDARLLFGYQRFLVKSEIIKLYAFFDLGPSVYNYKGSEGTYNGWTMEKTKVPFNLNGFGFVIQSGLGIKFKIFKRIYADLESSLFLGKRFNISEYHLLLQDNIIPRPLCLLGISYTFK